MLDLRIYHENLGDALLSENFEYAMWFVNDMDSILRSMAKEFTTHRKLRKPFEYYYRQDLRSYLRDMKTEIKTSDWKSAVRSYSVLTRKCNGCHVDHEVDKEVRDVTRE